MSGSDWWQRRSNWQYEEKRHDHWQQGLKIGFRGDSLMQTKTNGRKKKSGSFVSEVEAAFEDLVGKDGLLDYKAWAGLGIDEISKQLQNGPAFDILCLGIGVNDFLEPDDCTGKRLLHEYPESLDDDVSKLASVVLDKSKKSLILCGGPASLWGYPPRWDGFVERLHRTLRHAGLAVVPQESASRVLSQMELCRDGVHFSTDEERKAFFAKAWREWVDRWSAAVDTKHRWWNQRQADDVQSGQRNEGKAVKVVTLKSHGESLMDEVMSLVAAEREQARGSGRRWEEREESSQQRARSRHWQDWRDEKRDSRSRSRSGRGHWNQKW
eukprot:TRINITY_DN56019_c0_g1_i1.p1 TRINITY_DN56019_c0_g1~~TRINITY_DN56019_c0_g1_i1.p1  ORF type:complete len:325 (-),score=70.29 TRINITY_DN56019_c0_g1_i1:46-1020(-)